MRHALVFLVVILSVCLLMFTGCDSVDSTGAGGTADGGGSYNGGGGGYGATPGGAQDFSYIRSLINEGRVPNPENFLVEGIYSEYDLPLEGETPYEVLALKTACGHGGEFAIPEGGLYVQLGFSSNISEETFARESLNLSVVVDKSGSMRERSATEGMTKMDLVKQALVYLVEQLDEDDIISIVLFNVNRWILVEPRPVNQDELFDAIEEITAGGGTNMDVGLRQGYDFVREYQDNERSDRVILLTDALPNTGDYSPDNFQGIVSNGSEDGIGLTSFGVGLNFDQDLMNFFATQRGANYYYLDNDERAQELFVEDFDMMVTPLAYDLQVTIEPYENFDLTGAYGFPSPENQVAELFISTVFLSRNKGAVMLKFDRQFEEFAPIFTQTQIADLSISYETTDGREVIQNLPAIYSGPDIINPDDNHFGQVGVHKGTVLTRYVLTLQKSCELYYEYYNNDEAVELLEILLMYLQLERDVFDEEQYSDELELVRQLIENIEPEYY